MRRRLACGALLGLLAGACGKDEPLRAGEPTSAWRSLGFDSDNSRNNRVEKSLSPSNVGGLAPRWLVRDVTTGVTSTPAVVDGVVYFGEWGRTVRAVRASDGSELWRTSVPAPVRSSLLVTDDRVFASAGNQVFALKRADGALVWSTPVNDHPQTNLESSPVWAEGRIVIGVAGFEISLDKEDYTFRGSVVALDAAQGNELWRVYATQNDATSGAGVSVWSSAAVDTVRKRVFIGTGNTYEAPASPYSDAVLAINYETGELVWHTQFTVGDVFTLFNFAGPDADVGSSPNLFRAQGRDVVGAGSKAGLYKALDRDTGAVVWERQVGAGSPLGGIMTTSATDDEFVYVCSNAPTPVTTALRLDDGTTQWEATLPAPAYGALTLANGLLFQPTIGGLVKALDAASGEERWSVDLVSDLGGGISVVDGAVFIPRGHRFLTATHENAGGLAAFSLDGQAVIDFADAGSEGRDAGPFNKDQCLATTRGAITPACKDCSCGCDPTAVAACDQSCWALFSCVVDHCATQDFATSAGRACVERACTDVKLLPPDVQEATLEAAACMVACKDSC